jgi:hypothetical protein
MVCELSLSQVLDGTKFTRLVFLRTWFERVSVSHPVLILVVVPMCELARIAQYTTNSFKAAVVSPPTSEPSNRKPSPRVQSEQRSVERPHPVLLLALCNHCLGDSYSRVLGLEQLNRVMVSNGKSDVSEWSTLVSSSNASPCNRKGPQQTQLSQPSCDDDEHTVDFSWHDTTTSIKGNSRTRAAEPAVGCAVGAC